MSKQVQITVGILAAVAVLLAVGIHLPPYAQGILGTLAVLSWFALSQMGMQRAAADPRYNCREMPPLLAERITVTERIYGEQPAARIVTAEPTRLAARQSAALLAEPAPVRRYRTVDAVPVEWVEEDC